MMTLAALCNSAHAQTVSEPNPSQEQIRVLIDRLGSESWQERNQATQQLINQDKLAKHEASLEDLERFVHDPTLSPESRSRLVRACLSLFRSSPKGGLGVAFGAVMPGAIEVIPIQMDQRFPASTMLNPGDAIAMVDGEMLMDTVDLRAHILSRSPGDVLQATVLRNGTLIEMDLPLGSLDHLAGAAKLDPQLAFRALKLRWKRIGITLQTTDTIGDQISITQWERAAFPDRAASTPRPTNSRYPSAIITGIHRFIRTGNYQTRRVRLWDSLETLDNMVAANQNLLKSRYGQKYEAQRSLLETQGDMLNTEFNAAQDPDEIQRLTEEMDAIDNKLRVLDEQAAKFDRLIDR